MGNQASPAAVEAAQRLIRTVNDAGATMRIVTDESDVTIGETRQEKGTRLSRELKDAVEESMDRKRDAAATLFPDGISGVASTDPTRKVFPPTEDEFQDTDYIRTHDLDDVKNRLIATWPEFGTLQQCNIDILWRKSGGQGGGKLTFGKCTKMSGLALYYSGETFVIWIAADHVRDHEFTQLQLEALIYHELSHCGWEVDDKTGEMKWMVTAHDATVFFNEITRYGTWQNDLRILRQSYEQLALASGQ